MISGKARMIELAVEPSAYSRTVSYLGERMRMFLRPQDRVLLCFPDAGGSSMGAMVQKALETVGASWVIWGPDHSWQSLLRQAFFSRATAIVGPPLVILGLSKLTRATATPLSIRNVLLAGAPCEDWMIDGIQNGLDARIWGCYDPVPGALVGGFSCGKSRGVHIREDAVTVTIVGPEGEPLPDGQMGRILLSDPREPGVCFDTGDRGRLLTDACPCGCASRRLMDFAPGGERDPALDGLSEYLLSWTSILDYRAARTDMGLELEVVAFPGERLPVLPSCARRVVRPWMPKHDVPFCMLKG